MKISTRTKANTGLCLFFLMTSAITMGIVLHLKKHGIVIEPRATIKFIHWIVGVLGAGAAIVHGLQFRGQLKKMKGRLWFRVSTLLIVPLLTGVAATGFVKLLVPVKIANLGLWHYWLGIALAVTVSLHLVRGIPAYLRYRRIGRKVPDGTGNTPHPMNHTSSGLKSQRT